MIYCVEFLLLSLLFMCSSPLFMILVFMIYLMMFIFFLIFLMNSYYYSYIVYLLFMSGLLIMFMYICSIIYNEKIFLDFNYYFFLVGGSIFLLPQSFLGIYINYTVFYYEFLNLLKFFVFSFSVFSGFFFFFLFFCLMVVYEIIKKCGGPLRMK